MRILRDKLKNEKSKITALGNYARFCDYNKGIELRQEKEKAIAKYKFFEKLNLAFEKQEKM